MNVVNWLTDQSLIERLGWTLMHSLWQGVVFAALLAVILRAMRSAPVSMRYTTACAAMALMVFAAAATFGLLKREPAPAPHAPVTAALGMVSSTVLPLTAPMPLIVAPPVVTPNTRILRALVLAWFVGVAVMAMWHIAGWVWLQRLRRGGRMEQLEPILSDLATRLGITRLVRLIETTRVDVPAVVGALRPVILVPLGLLNDLPASQIQAILAHELAHIRRHDYLVNLVQAAIESVLFYHPATWWISAQIRIERENCCDDVAARACGDRRDYAAALAALEARRSAAIAHLAPAATGGRLVDRVRRLLRVAPARRRGNHVRSLAAAALALACVAVPLFVAAQNAPTVKQPTATTQPAVAKEELAPTPILPEDLNVVVEDYRIAPGDLLFVTIADLQGPGIDTVKKLRASETGNISLPYVDGVKVAMLTTAEAEKLIRKSFQDKHIMANPQVSVQVDQATGRNFSMLGQVDRPGQYQIVQPDFRVLDALATAGGRPASIKMLRVIRSHGGSKRVLDIPLDKLAAGDTSVNVVIRPGDMLIAAPGEKRFVKIVVSKDAMLQDGKPTDLAALTKFLNDIPEADRRDIAIEVAAASPDITVDRFFSIAAQLQGLVDKFHLAHLSQTGVQQPATPATPTTKAATQARSAAAQPLEGFYYMQGNVKRAGAYSVARREITLAQAIAAAGGADNTDRPSYVEVIRRVGPEDEVILAPMELSAALEGKTAKVLVRPNDVVKVKLFPAIAATQPAADASPLSTKMKMRDDIVAELTNARSRLGDAHPQVRRLRDLLATLDRAIAQQSQNSLESIASVDPTMRQYLNTLESMEFNLARLGSNLGPKHVTYLSAQKDIEIQKQRINTYADNWRKTFGNAVPLKATTQP
jgi:protein involved in polysaccharide export with SLBB domain/beta-lactamase regulating signal transducer with metallopeptidase domain